MIYEGGTTKTATRTSAPRDPRSALQRKADQSKAVAHLAGLQRAASAMQVSAALQLYATAKQKGQDGHFIPKMTAAIHCHVGRKMRQPHLKIRGEKYNFGPDYDDAKMQTAYDALTGDAANAALEGYADCVEYLEEMGCT